MLDDVSAVIKGYQFEMYYLLIVKDIWKTIIFKHCFLKHVQFNTMRLVPGIFLIVHFKVASKFKLGDI